MKVAEAIKAPKIQHAQSVVLVARYKDADGVWRRHPAAYGPNGRVKPGAVRRDRKTVLVADPVYEIRYYEGRRAKFWPAGKRATDAEAQRLRIEKQVSAKNTAEDAGIKIEALPADRKSIRNLFAEYIDNAKQRDALEAAEQAKVVSGEFLKITTKTFVDEIDPREVVKYHAALRERGQSDRTISNKHGRLRAMLRFGRVNTEDRNVFPADPGYEKKLPTIYTSEQVNALFKAVDGRMRISLLLCMKIGLREGEATHAEFSDIDWSRSIFRVRSKPKWNHKVKDSEERDVPIPSDMLRDLKAWRESRPERERDGLITPTRTGKPMTKLLLHLKNLAHDNRLNCTRCRGCKHRTKDGWGCKEWTLHKLRRTYLTTLLRNQVDLRTVQEFAGHADMESTMRYLRPAEAKEVQAKIDSIKW